MTITATKKSNPFLIKSNHLIRVHFFIDHWGYSIGASVRKLHFCSMCSKETQMKRIFYYGKQTFGPNQINLESHQNFTKIFFYELDSVRDWQFLKKSVKTKDTTVYIVESLVKTYLRIYLVSRVSSDLNNNKFNSVQNSVSKNQTQNKIICFLTQNLTKEHIASQ